MSIVNKLLKKLSYRVINGKCSEEFGPLLIRYFIYRGDNIGIYLHHLLRSDHRIMHDHPWSFWSIILKGAYIEHTPNKICAVENCEIHINKEFSKKYKQFSILKRPAKWIHRLEMSHPCWTLVIRFEKEKTWGFFTQEGFINWREYKYSGPCDGE